MNDERNVASGSWARMPAHHGREAIAAPPALHAAQQPGRGVLQRQVEVRHDRRELEHRRDERVLHLRRIQVEQPHTCEAVVAQAVETAQQRRERAGLAGVAPVPREVLRDEHDLGDAFFDEVARFGFDRTRECANAASRGTTGSRRRRTPGRSLRRPSRTPTARSAWARGSSSRSRTPVGLRPRSSTFVSPTSASAPSPAKPMTASASGSAAASSSP